MSSFDMESVVKGLELGLRETRQDVKELQSAMVGSVDGTKKGFAQQLLAVMKEMEEISTNMRSHNGRISGCELEQVRFKGTIQGAKISVVAFWSVISLITGVALALLVHK